MSYVGQIYEIVRIRELTEETGDPSDWFLPVDSTDYTLEPKKVDRAWLVSQLEKIMGIIKVEKGIACETKDSPIRHPFYGDDFPDTNYKLVVECKTEQGYYFRPVVTEEAVGSFTFEISEDCTMEYSAVYAPLPSGS